MMDEARKYSPYNWTNTALQCGFSPFMLEDTDSVRDIADHMKDKVVRDFVSSIEMDKPYIVRMSDEIERDPLSLDLWYRIRLSVREVPEEQVSLVREFRIVDVDALEIESINCKNCGAPIPVGRLDLNGDTLVRCSYCGTYHRIRRKH